MTKDNKTNATMSRENYESLLSLIRHEMWQDIKQFAELKNALATQCRSFEERCAMLLNVFKTGFKQVVMTNYQQVALYEAAEKVAKNGIEEDTAKYFASLVHDVEEYRDWVEKQRAN